MRRLRTPKSNGYEALRVLSRTVNSGRLNSNDNLGILSIVGGTGQPIVTGADSYVLGQINLTGTDLVTLKIDNEQSDALTFSIANWPQNGCNPTTTTEGCTYSTKSLTVPNGQPKTVTYIAPSNYNNMGFTVQKAANNCVGNCSTYIPDWSAGVNGTSCSDVSPSAGQNMAAGQTWTMYAQSQTTGYNGFLDGPGMPGSQNSSKYPNGCVFAMNTAFQNWIANQPGWAKWLEGAVGAAIGIALAVFAGPEIVAWAAEDAVDDVLADGTANVIDGTTDEIMGVSTDVIDDWAASYNVDAEELKTAMRAAEGGGQNFFEWAAEYMANNPDGAVPGGVMAAWN
jgi:hypothetical protein